MADFYSEALYLQMNLNELRSKITVTIQDLCNSVTEMMSNDNINKLSTKLDKQMNSIDITIDTISQLQEFIKSEENFNHIYYSLVLSQRNLYTKPIYRVNMIFTK